MNRFDFIGRLTNDPEEKMTQNGDPVYRLRIAVSRTYKAEGQPEADFFNLVIFGKAAERFGKLNVQKGTKLLFTGDVRNNNYTDKDGVKHYDIQFVVNQFEFCESKKAQDAGQEQQAATVKPQATVAAAEAEFMDLNFDISDEGLPF